VPAPADHALPPPDAADALARGLELRVLGRTREALEALQAASRDLPRDDVRRSWLHAALGELELRLGEPDRALAELEQAVEVAREVSQAMGDSVRRADALELENGLLCRLPLLEKVRAVPGWLTDPEADLLSAATAQAIPLAREANAALVELGSYCGKSTLAIALTLQALAEPGVALHAIDPHEAYAFAGGVDTHAVLVTTLARFGVSERVEVVRAHSWEVEWERPIAFLFLDALHDYENLRRDHACFADWLVPRALVAFHDHSSAFPGVRRLVQELRDSGDYRLAAQRDGLVVLRRREVA
jgi:tetratricopeptide (TPR) repeat protein